MVGIYAYLPRVSHQPANLAKMIFEHRYLPQSLYTLELADIPGNGKRMKQRMPAGGITIMR
jgi:hypothetical protein